MNREAKLEAAAQALIEFDDFPLQAKRPDVFAMRMRRLREALATPTDDSDPSEITCPDCGRHVLARDGACLGWLTACGKRLSRLDECGQHTRCTTDEHGETILPSSSLPAVERAPVVTDEDLADQIIGQIEERFPNWRSYRDLIDCIDCTLSDLRRAQP